jgi:hypothetical protein
VWLVVHLGDVRSDLSVFHRIDDLDSLDAARFTSLVTRLPVYDGAVRHAMRRDLEQRETAAQRPAQRTPAPAVAESQPVKSTPHSSAHFAALNKTREFGPLGVNQAGVFDLG